MSDPAPHAAPRAASWPRAAVRLGAFIGREAELAHLADLSAQGARLITLTGPPGIGKTRLAQEFAAARPHPAIFCDLTEAHTLEQAVLTVAAAVDARAGHDASSAALVERIGHAVAGRGALWLLLDNFEQLVGCATDAVRAWLVAAPELRVLVTSRERLRVDPEHVCELAPLEVPGPDRAPAACAAVQLLVERGARARPGFALTDANAALLGRIAAELEGIPLALELAAARLGTLDPAALLERLAQRLDVLARGARDARDRQRTLRAALDWSWTLLAPHEQAALAQCAVFHGPFTVDAAERVVDLSAWPDAPPVLDVLDSLRDKSLVRRDDDPTAHDAAPAQLALFATIRAWAAERLAADPAMARAAHTRHAEFYVARAEAADAGGEAALRRLLADRENLLAAIARALEAEPATAEAAALALRALLALDAVAWSGLTLAGHLALLDAALARAHATGLDDAALVARARTTRGRYRVMHGRLDEGRADHDAALAEARRAGDHGAEALALHNLGRLHNTARRLSEAEACLREARRCYRVAGDGRGEALAVWQAAVVAHRAGDFAQARRRCERALALAERFDIARVARLALDTLGHLALEAGDLAQARRHYEALARDVAMAALEPTGFHAEACLALVDHAAGRLDAAIPRYERAVHAARALGHQGYHGMYRVYLAGALLERDELEKAAEHLWLGVRLLREAGDWRHEALGSALLGAVLASRGDLAGAERALDAAQARLEGRRDVLAAAVELYRVPLDLAGAPRDEAALDRARARVAAAEHARDEPAPATRSVDARLALRFARRALARAAPAEVAPAAPVAATSPGVLAVDARGRWFRLPDGERVACTGRAAVRSVLARLAAERVASPGTPLAVDALFEAGWPGEHAHPEAARNRVYVVLAILRKLGLRALLVRDGGGYLLDPDVPAQIGDAAPAARDDDDASTAGRRAPAREA